VGKNGFGESPFVKTPAGYNEPDHGADRGLEGESLDLDVATDAHHKRLRFVHQVRSKHG
jgi:ABC-type sugar transport system ATPase subunit